MPKPRKTGFTTKPPDGVPPPPEQESLPQEPDNLLQGNWPDKDPWEEEPPWTSEYAEGDGDLDAAMEVSAVSASGNNEVQDDEYEDLAALGISIIEKNSPNTIESTAQNEEQHCTPLADIGDADFSKGKRFKLPCSNRKLEKMLKEIGIDGIATTEADYKVKITNSICPALGGIVVDSPNFKELNFLAKRLKKMSPEEIKTFNKVLELERHRNPSITPADAINISYNLDNYKVYDVSGVETVEERFEKLGAQLSPRLAGETDQGYKDRMQANGEAFANTDPDNKLSRGFASNAFVTQLESNQKIYQSPADIDKLSGFVNDIKSFLKLK